MPRILLPRKSVLYDINLPISALMIVANCQVP